jgi:hypothetical protein
MMRALPLCSGLLGAACALLPAPPICAQTPPPLPDAKPPASAPAAVAAKPAPKPAPARQRIELPASERPKSADAGDAPQTTTLGGAPTAADLVPGAADTRVAVPEEPVTRIEQSRTREGNRQVTVTPALTGRPYTMTQREGQIPFSATGSSSGLSVPKFFTFEWGRSEERSPSAPPPPTSSTPR